MMLYQPGLFETESPISWDDLPSVHELFSPAQNRWQFRDKEITSKLRNVANRVVADVYRFGSHSEFLMDMATMYTRNQTMTIPMVRGVLNTLGGGIHAHRRRFRISRDSRRDRDHGLENCMVCGYPLIGPVAVARGLGDTCYRNVLGANYSYDQR